MTVVDPSKTGDFRFLKPKEKKGYKIEETLKTYSHLFTSTLDEVVAVIDNLDNNKTDDV